MDILTAKTLASELDGVQYRDEVNSDVRARAKAAGLVIVYGASDDLIEFDGAIYDEFGAYGGHVEGEGVAITPRGFVESACDSGDCPHEEKARCSAVEIRANWCPDGVIGNPLWNYKVPFPHHTFRVMEDDELYCIGAVFALADVPEPAQ